MNVEMSMPMGKVATRWNTFMHARALCGVGLKTSDEAPNKVVLGFASVNTNASVNSSNVSGAFISLPSTTTWVVNTSSDLLYDLIKGNYNALSSKLLTTLTKNHDSSTSMAKLFKGVQTDQHLVILAKLYRLRSHAI
jgi:hypothetical protein